jgi:ferredoxin
MRIVVDLNRCLGYAQCVPLAPDVLKLSGEEALMFDPNPDDAQRLRVLRAAASCPVQAIIVDQLDAKEEGKRKLPARADQPFLHSCRKPDSSGTSLHRN